MSPVESRSCLLQHGGVAGSARHRGVPRVRAGVVVNPDRKHQLLDTCAVITSIAISEGYIENKEKRKTDKNKDLEKMEVVRDKTK